MGLIRILLALSVIITHSKPIFGITLLPGNLAVEAFFMISGFYMSLVLKEKYFKINNYYKLFISSRFLRIFPSYWFFLVIVILFFLAEGLRMGNFHYLQLYADYWNKLNPITLLYLVITNILIIGQEFAIFFTVNNNGSLTYTTNSLITKAPLIKFLLDLPVWTISLEITFYLISPLIVRLKTGLLILIIILLLIIRLILKFENVAYDPYIYRLLPNQIIFFFSGVLSYTLYKYLQELDISKTIYNCSTVSFILFTIFYGNLVSSDLKDFVYLASMFFLIPISFKFSKESKMDRYLGELSYPIYISHVLFIDISERIVHRYGLNQVFFPLLGITFTFIFSILLNKFFIRRFEVYRSKRIADSVKDINISTR